jgi:putative oxidoreductase
VFSSLGYRPGMLAALAAGICEAGGALLILTGLLPPLAGAMLLGSMLNAAAVQSVNGLWFANRGAEYPIVLGTVAVALAFTGPGSVSLSQLWGWHLSGWWWGLAALVAGFVGAALVLAGKRLSARTEEPA